METAITILTGLFLRHGDLPDAVAHIIRILLGVAILGNAVNLTIFTNGRITREVPPIIPEGRGRAGWRRSPIRCRRRWC
jgi:multicomponent Na+:H+ antiporter subunit C